MNYLQIFPNHFSRLYRSLEECTRCNFQYILKKKFCEKGTLSLYWVSNPGPFDCRSNALLSEPKFLHKKIPKLKKKFFFLS